MSVPKIGTDFFFLLVYSAKYAFEIRINCLNVMTALTRSVLVYLAQLLQGHKCKKECHQKSLTYKKIVYGNRYLTEFSL